MSSSLQNTKVGSQTETPGWMLDDVENVPLSFAQQRLWFIDQLEPGSPLYNVPSAIRLKGFLDVDALRESLQAIVDRHEVLRTVYKVVDGVPVQEVRASVLLEFPVVDLTCASVERREAELMRTLQNESQRCFDLSDDLMIRTLLFRLQPDEHVLFLNVHHIACDEWSMGLIFRELAGFYQQRVSQNKADGRELPIQYADYAVWQREVMQGRVVEQQLAFWRENLAGELPVLELPGDGPRVAATDRRGGVVKHCFSDSFSVALRHFARQEGITPFILMLSAFKTLLHRYTGQEDLIVGTPVSGRNRVETEELIGFFVNTLPMRTRVTGEASFRHLLNRVKETVLAAFSHQDLPFEKLVEEIQPERKGSQNPIFNVAFTFQNPQEPIEISGLSVSLVEIESVTAKFDLTMVVRDELAQLSVLLEYKTDLCSEAFAARMLTHLEVLLSAALANPNQSVATLPLLTPGESNELLVRWNQTASDFPREATVHHLFEAQAARSGDAVAVVYDNDSITYRQLNERASQLANYLRRLGVGPNVLVGICVERSIEMIVGWLGILKAGGAYVPLDPGYPAERLEFMLDDTKMPVLLTQKCLASRLPKSTRRICLDSDWKLISRESEIAPKSGATAENSAYVIYTSGSTGKPKGVVVPHRAIARLLFQTNYVQLSPSHRIAQASNASFDAATFEIWGALLHGARLIGMKQDVLLSPRDLAMHLRENRISTIFLTTALFNQIAADVPDAFCRLEHVLFGGEACDPKAVREVITHGPPVHLLHVYGPTECTTFASWYEVTEIAEGARTLPIGRPISNTTFYVFDARMQPVPIGVPGELFIGGAGVACGYFNRPELTAIKFVRNPFGPESDRLYRTGDLVRYLAGGDIEFLGRLDHQVKIRGFRIELEEIETVLKQIDNVRDAVVVARDGGSGKRLIAYIVTARPNAVSPEKLREHAKQKLPDFMVPSGFIFLDALPLTPNGKVDRRALPAPQAQLESEKCYLPPRNNLENQLRKIWENVLGCQPVGVRDNFFELGGHSLLAVRLFTQIESKLGLKLPLSTLFQAPTIEQLAQVIGKKSWSSPGASLVEIQPGGTRPPIFWLHTLGGGGGGGLFTYRKLAKLLGPDQPSYGLVTPPEPFTRIEDMAAHYINEMRTIQPTGPYYLGGYCFGGVIAFEMARQLEERGMSIGLVALIESMPPNFSAERRWDWAMISHVIRTLPAWSAYQVAQGPGEVISKVRRKLAMLRQRSGRGSAASENDSSAAIHEQLGSIIDFSNYPADFKRYAEFHWRALGNYRPQILNGRVTLFRTQRPRLLDMEPEVSWGRLAVGGVNVRLIEGTHENILEEPFVANLARELFACLRQEKPELLEVKAA